jgi:hypothetical protein
MHWTQPLHGELLCTPGCCSLLVVGVVTAALLVLPFDVPGAGMSVAAAWLLLLQA